MSKNVGGQFRPFLNTVLVGKAVLLAMAYRVRSHFPVDSARKIGSLFSCFVVGSAHKDLRAKIAEYGFPGLFERRVLQSVDRLRCQKSHTTVLAGERKESAITNWLSRHFSCNLCAFGA